MFATSFISKVIKQLQIDRQNKQIDKHSENRHNNIFFKLQRNYIKFHRKLLHNIVQLKEASDNVVVYEVIENTICKDTIYTKNKMLMESEINGT